jgi:RNA polymerase sigma factor (TIGR02999 family)
MAGLDMALQEVPRGEITRHPQAWTAGDDSAAATAFSVLYETLCQLARRALSTERSDHPLGAAGLVSEAFLRMSTRQRIAWQSRDHFIATVARMMRRILIDDARSRGTAKRGHGEAAATLDDAALVASESCAGLVAVHEALAVLSVHDAMQARIVKLRFFGGLTRDEIASQLGVSPATVERRWRRARAWLHRQISDSST